MNTAVILAGGIGARLYCDKPKQFLIFAGKTCLEYTLDVFFKNKNTDRIIVVVHKDWMQYTNNILGKILYNKPYDVISGGRNRNQSTYHALQFLEKYDKCNNVIIHDAVRPFVIDRIIDDCVRALYTVEAVDVVVPVVDTIVRVKEGVVVDIPVRQELFCSQTPQAFRFESIKQAYDQAYKIDENLDGFSDDCGLFKQYFPEKEIQTIAGEYFNLKLTRKEDVPILEKLFQMKFNP